MIMNRLVAAGLIVSVLGGVAYAQKANPKRAAAKKPEEPTPPPPMRTVTIAKVDPNTREQTLAAAAQIDKLVEANYARHKVQPNPLTSDEVFVRRAYLEITGTIPTLKQARDFLSARD